MKSAPRSGFKWICLWEMTACRRQCDCRKSDPGNAGPCILHNGRVRSAMESLERVKTAVRSAESAGANFWTILLRPLKAGIAEIAATKSSQQFGREEEKE